MIIDFHTHAFPDRIAENALAALSANAKVYGPYTDGTIRGLIRSMDSAGIELSVIANISTKPQQNQAILQWSEEIRSERIEPLGSVHPGSPHIKQEILAYAERGFKGLKLHPLYQNFQIDDEKMFPYYEYVTRNGLFLLIHCGYDIAFPGNVNARPSGFRTIKKEFPELKIIAAHFGGWHFWDETIECLLSTDVFFDTSFIHEINSEQRKALVQHSPERLLFGSDSPWLMQDHQINFVKSIFKNPTVQNNIFSGNALKLLKKSYSNQTR